MGAKKGKKKEEKAFSIPFCLALAKKKPSLAAHTEPIQQMKQNIFALHALRTQTTRGMPATCLTCKSKPRGQKIAYSSKYLNTHTRKRQKRNEKVESREKRSDHYLSFSARTNI